jgi:predicted permease
MMVKILQVLLPVILGLSLRRLGILKRSAGERLARWVFFGPLPVLVYLVLLRTEVPGGAGLLLPLCGFLAGIILLLTSLLLAGWLKLERNTAGVLLPGASISNIMYFGLPFFVFFYGNEGVARVTFLDLGNVFFACTVAYLASAYYGAAQDNKGMACLKKMVFLPPLWAVVMALLCKGFDLYPPQWLIAPLGLLAASTTPLIMLAIGLLLELHIKRVGPTALGLAIKMGVGLAVGLSLAALFALDGMNRAVVTLAPAMPISTLTIPYAVENGLDTEYAASLVSTGLLLGLVTTPLLFALF